MMDIKVENTCDRINQPIRVSPLRGMRRYSNREGEGMVVRRIYDLF
jgi:hypothetical protein